MDEPWCEIEIVAPVPPYQYPEYRPCVVLQAHGSNCGCNRCSAVGHFLQMICAGVLAEADADVAPTHVVTRPD